MLPQKFFDYIWTFVPFVISRGLHRGLLPKRDKLMESTHTVGLIFWGSCSPDCRSTAPNNVGSFDNLGWNTKRLSRLLPLVFLGLCLAVKTPEEDRFRFLHCLSCDQVGRRFIATNTKRSRNCFSRRTDFPRMLIWVLWGNVSSNYAAVFWRQQSLGKEAPVWADWRVQTPSHQSSGCWRENLSQEGSNRISCATNAGELVQTLPKVVRKHPSLPSGVDPQETFFSTSSRNKM